MGERISVNADKFTRKWLAEIRIGKPYRLVRNKAYPKEGVGMLIVYDDTGEVVDYFPHIPNPGKPKYNPLIK